MKLPRWAQEGLLLWAKELAFYANGQALKDFKQGWHSQIPNLDEDLLSKTRDQNKNNQSY